jgi:hypothetical protein
MSQAIASLSYRSGGGDPRSNPNSHGAPRALGQRPQWDDDPELDADGEADAEGEYLDEEHSSTPPPSRGSTTGNSMHRATSGGGAQRRAWPVGLADLDSPSGRYVFMFPFSVSLFHQ